MTPVAVDLFDTLRCHWEWRVRLRLAVKGLGEPVDARAVGDAAACELGVWLDGEGRVHRDLASFAELCSAHTAFHAAATEVGARMAVGDGTGAEALLASETRFEHASNAVVLAILKLMRDLGPEG